MQTYLARYTVWADMYDGGAFMPDPEPHKPEYRFDVDNKEKARKVAEDYIPELAKRFFGPRITLDELLEINEVELKR